MKTKKDQYQRFLEAAKEHGVDETGAELERAFKKAVPPKVPISKKIGPRESEPNKAGRRKSAR